MQKPRHYIVQESINEPSYPESPQPRRSERDDPMKYLGTIRLAQIALISAILIAAHAQAASLTPDAYQIDQSVTNALNQLYAHNEAARALGSKAKAVLVFPDVRKGAFIVGAQYGYGALRRGGKTIGYYRTGAASYGFQAGVKSFGYALFFMTSSALSYLEKSGGWAIGTGPSIVVVDQGFARSMTTTSMRSDVYAFVFDQKGLMGGMGIEGSKITKISPGS
jgi:lipid-binding SYLF domain-containing protein